MKAARRFCTGYKTNSRMPFLMHLCTSCLCNHRKFRLFHSTFSSYVSYLLMVICSVFGFAMQELPSKF